MHTLFLLLRRAASFLYDLLLLIAVFFIVTTVLVLVNNGENVSHPLFFVLLWLVGGVFFDGFWRHGGQTLGMRAWHLRLIAFDAQKNTHESLVEPESLSARDTWKRYAFGTLLFGVGYLWAFVDKDGITAIDRLSRSKIIKDSNHLRNSA